MIKLPVITKNQWFIATIVLLVIVILILLLFPARKSSEYRKTVKALTAQRDSFKEVIAGREADINALEILVNAGEIKLDTVNFLNNILNQKIKKYEKDITHVNSASTDDNIIFLSKYLSTETSN
jgi:hypothetical protein